jgi:Sulfotransferase domain
MFLWRRSAKPQTKIFVNTIPKSGSVFIESALCEIAGCKHLVLGTGYFPNDTLLIDVARRFTQGGYSAQQHADCRPNNIAILEKFVSRWVVHFRDPRSVALSWTHHLDESVRRGWSSLLDQAAPIPDKDYLSLDFNGRLDWQITHFLPHVVDWTTAWLAYADKNNESVLVSRFEDMVADQNAFFLRLLDFFEVSPKRMGNVSRFRSAAAHFRTGEVAEWRGVFSEPQKARALAMIPQELRERLAWPVA